MVLLAGGCKKRTLAPAPASVSEPAGPVAAQPKLATMKLWVGPKEIVVEQAVTPDQVETGLMYRKEMGPDEGMLFIFEEAHRPAFWMHNTYLPLSCAYIESSGTIVEIHDLKPMDETPVVAASTNRVQYVLEMNKGWFDRNGVSVGSVVRTEQGSLSQTYFGQP